MDIGDTFISLEGIRLDIRSVLGLPDLLDSKKVICVQPHPDDNEVGMAGTIRELSRRGCEVIYITVTDGRAGSFDGSLTSEQLIEVRRQEMEVAGRILGVAKQIHLNFPDAGDYSEDDVFSELLKHVRLEKPDMVFTVDPWMAYEAHPDHVKTGHAVARAVLFSKNSVMLPEYEPFGVAQIGFYQTSYPNTFVDISEHMQTKMQSILAHASQFANPEGDMVQAYLGMLAQECYTEGYLKHHEHAQANGFAEAFKVLATQQLHSMPSTIFS